MSFEDDPCVLRWLGGLAETTQANRLPLLRSFFEFVGMRPSEAVEHMRLHPNDYRFVDAAYEWLEGNGNLMVSTMACRVSVVRGFFLANRVPLPKDKHGFHSEKEPVPGELTVDEFRKILTACNVMYRAVYLLGFFTGSGTNEVVYINTHHAEQIFQDIRKGKRIIRLNMRIW